MHHFEVSASQTADSRQPPAGVGRARRERGAPLRAPLSDWRYGAPTSTLRSLRLPRTFCSALRCRARGLGHGDRRLRRVTLLNTGDQEGRRRGCAREGGGLHPHGSAACAGPRRRRRGLFLAALSAGAITGQERLTSCAVGRWGSARPGWVANRRGLLWQRGHSPARWAACRFYAKPHDAPGQGGGYASGDWRGPPRPWALASLTAARSVAQRPLP